MRYRSIHLTLFVAVFTLVFTGCSTQKDKFLNRAYHRLTARDNGWFNANEKLKEVVASIEDAHVDNYDEVLPVFVYGTEAQAKAAHPELEVCIEKVSVVIDRHSMSIKKKERNKWIDDAYFVFGKSYFYQQKYLDAERIFKFVSERHKGSNREHEARLWLTRTYVQLERYAKARSTLDLIKEEKELHKRFPHDEMAAVQADVNLKLGKNDDAIIDLERAVELTKNRDKRTRYAFILAQLYHVKGQPEKAIQQFAKVVRMNPPYEIAFHAQIFQALAANSVNGSKAIRAKLNRMLRDDKHVDHYDMVHYALADLDLKEGLQEPAIAHLKTSTQVSTTDTKQKAKSYLRLADLYFDDRIYTAAQQYYDSTSTVLDPTHIRFEEVETKAAVLGDLVEQLNIIQLEDSLQTVGAMDPEEREKLIRRIIREKEAELAEALRLEEEARELNPTVAATPAKPTTGGGKGNWYFYNPQSVGRGAASFKKTWGSRKLEDNWRRKDKTGSATFIDETALDETEEEGNDEVKAADEPWKDPEFYMQGVPLDEEAITASNERICEAMYRSGMIYKEELDDQDNSVESFEVLTNRFDECRYTPESFYQLYRIYLEKEAQEGYFNPDGGGAEMYRTVILNRYPESEFARLIRNPDEMAADSLRRLTEAEDYKALYTQFKRNDYTTVIVTSNQVISNEPDNNFLGKYHLLRAMAIGGKGDLDGFRSALQEVTTKFSGTDDGEAATKLLGALKSPDKGEQQENPDKQPEGPSYAKEDGDHYVALVFPNEGSDVNTMKVKISNFNNRYFRNVNIQVTNSFIDTENQIILLRLFESSAKAMEYYGLFTSESDVLKGVNDQGYVLFAISPDNYAQLFKSKDVSSYTDFFAKNYTN